MGIKRAKTKEVRKLTAAGLGVAPTPGIKLRKVYAPHSQKQTQMLTGSPQEQAAQLVEKLKHDLRAI
jgi:electron transfer flavoprotein beta subunit